MTSTRHDSNDTSLTSSSGPARPTVPTFCPCQSVESCNPSSSSSSSSTGVSGGSRLTVYCPTCVRRLLTAQIDKHAMALEERNRSREWCADQLLELRSDDNNDDNNNDNDNDNENCKLDDETNCSRVPAAAKTAAAYQSPRHKIAQYRDSFSHLQKKLEVLRRDCVTVSVSLASKSMANEERATDLNVQKNRIIVARQELERLENSVLFSKNEASSNDADTSTNTTGEHHSNNNNPLDQNNGGGSTLNDSLQLRIQEVKQKRFHLALQAFEMHRMDVGTEYKNLMLNDFIRYDNNNNYNNNNDTDTSKNDKQIAELTQFQRRIRDKVISGIGKIGGLPLPHRGALYNYLKSDVLTSSLRLVASLTQLLARCLGILLPRPILLRPIMEHTPPSDRNTSKLGGNNNNPRFVSNVCQFKHQTDDIITNVTSTPGWYQLEKQATKKGTTNTTSPPNITTMQDLEELGGETNHCTTEDSTTTRSGGGASNSVHVASDSLDNNTAAATAAPVSNDTLSQSYQRAKSSLASTSTNSLLSLVGSSSKMLNRAFDKMKGNQNQHQQSNNSRSTTTGDGANMDDGIPNVVMASMDDLSVSTRLRHASCAVICDNITSQQQQQRNDSGTNGMHYELRPPQYSSNTNSTPNSSSNNSGGVDRDALNQQEENFVMGLHLLQNNVIALSLQAGVPVSALWPAEAVLLNLHSLKLFCMEQNLR